MTWHRLYREQVFADLEIDRSGRHHPTGQRLYIMHPALWGADIGYVISFRKMSRWQARL